MRDFGKSCWEERADSTRLTETETRNPQLSPVMRASDSLPVSPRPDSLQREILIQFGPVKTKRGQEDVIKLCGSASFQPAVALDGKAERGTALQNDDDVSFGVMRGLGAIGQSGHAICE